MIKLTGTLIKNYFHCPRQAYLYYYGLNFYNEKIRIGELMHKEAKSREIIFESLKVDDIKDGILIEYKKTSSNFEGTFFQVLYYLSYFHSKGLKISAKIRDLTYHKDYIVRFNKENEKKLKAVKKEIENLLKGKMPERLQSRKNCKGCSFFDYCWVE